jgi:ABC-2 type transport system permease protein
MLNTVACLLVLATLTTRFVFPLVSLEGRRFWILGLAPLRIATIVRQKFWLAVVFSAGVTVSLTAASSWRLRLAPVPFVITVLTVCAASFALSGLAVGLGSLYPDFTADSPARIVSGTGGTLTFLVSLVYITVVAGAETYVLRWRDVSPWSAAAAAAAIAIVSLAATTIPLRLGVANLERSDF